MLEFCRRYCRDVIANASKKDAAEEAILFAYTAAIAACAKPPLTSLASSSSQEPSHVGTTTANYRSKSFLLSLLSEMEYGYTKEDGRSIRPNSYTLSAVLLGIDDSTEAMNVLEEFE